MNENLKSIFLSKLADLSIEKKKSLDKKNILTKKEPPKRLHLGTESVWREKIMFSMYIKEQKKSNGQDLD